MGLATAFADSDELKRANYYPEDSETYSPGAEKLRESLISLTAEAFESMNLSMPEDLPLEEALSRLIIETAKKSGQKVVVLFDGCDDPLTNILHHPEKNNLEGILGGFYSQLASCEELVHFAFFTGRARFLNTTELSKLGSFSDISLSPAYGAICGFTHKELGRFYASRLKMSAKTLEMDPGALLDKLQSYYEGFCFDGQIRLYNPLSILNFLIESRFAPNFFESLSRENLFQYVKDNHLTVEEFRGMPISGDLVRNPGNLEESYPELRLYSEGCLSLRPGRASGAFTLDYSNFEVLEAASRLWAGAKSELLFYPEKRFIALKSAFEISDLDKAVSEINYFLAFLTYDDLVLHERLKRRFGETPSREYFYRSSLLTLLRAAGLDVMESLDQSEPDGPSVAFKAGSKAFVLDLEVFQDKDEDDKAAEAALARIRGRKGLEALGSPLLAVGLAISAGEAVKKGAKPSITSWRTGELAP
jgi:hypothetical protein